jgi:DNA-directed RNA polymerase specialized sigma24 family protein
MSSNEVKSLVDTALKVLKEKYPEDYALLYELYFDGASLHALSRTLHIPRSTLRSRKKKALLHLKAIIEEMQNWSWKFFIKRIQ